MRRTLRNVVYAVAATAALLIPIALTANEDGPKARHSGAPGDNPLACATALCHTSDDVNGGPLNAFGGSVTATFSQGATYTPGGAAVTITVRVNDPQNNNANGFQMTARLGSDLAHGQAGRFVPASGTFVECEIGSPRVPNGNCSPSFPIEFIEHDAPRAGTWTFTWTPPPTDVGPVQFYLAGNASNGDRQKDGNDHIYTNSYVLTPLGACTSAAPVIDAIISAGAFGARTDFTGGSWLEIYGSNLSTKITPWTGADFADAAAPTLLDRVRVSFDGTPGYVGFISPGQVNVQAPAGVAGASQVTVTNCTQTSAAKSLTREATAPGLLAPPGGIFVVDGKQHIAAFFLDGAYVGNIPGVNSRPAKPGDLITAYGVGFGATDPAVAPGTVVNGLPKLTNFSAAIGGVTLTPSQIVYAGLAPNLVGLYQFNLIVPNVADGDQQVTMTVGGRPLTQNVFIRVKR